MILHGTRASMMMLLPPLTGEVPEGATAHLDFLDEFYWVDGSERSLGSILGGTFDAGKIEARGLYISNVAAGRHSPDAIGVLFTVLADGLANGCTIVTEFEPIPDNAAFSVSGLHVAWYDNADPDLASDTLFVQSTSDGILISDDGVLSFEDADNWNAPATQPQRAAYTVARDTGGSREYAVSVNGSAAATTTSADSHSFTPARIALWAVEEWSWWPDDWCIRSFTVYPAQEPAALAALSTI
jgi:hypothetical protein